MFDWFPNPFILPVGLAIGVLIAAPVGPVNILCIQRAIERGGIAGLAAGLGAVLADGLIAAAAAFGIGALADVVAAHRVAIQGVGALVLVAFAIQLWRTEPVLVTEPGPTLDHGHLLPVIGDLPKAFLLTITNPAAVLGLLAIFGSISSFVEVRGKIDAAFLVAAIMTGSLLWWLGLSVVVGAVRLRIDDRWLARINHTAAILLIAFAIVLLAELAFEGLLSRA